MAGRRLPDKGDGVVEAAHCAGFGGGGTAVDWFAEVPEGLGEGGGCNAYWEEVESLKDGCCCYEDERPPEDEEETFPCLSPG